MWITTDCSDRHQPTIKAPPVTSSRSSRASGRNTELILELLTRHAADVTLNSRINGRFAVSVAAGQKLVDALLDGLAYRIGEVEHDHRIVGLVPQMLGLDRLAELDQPLRGKRYQTERPQPRERGRDREVRDAQQPRQ